MSIHLKNISKSFDGTTNVIDELNLNIEDGEFVSLLGPSGCGKTTTMLMIAGIHKVNDGNIYFGEQRVNDVEPKNRNIGMVFQSYALYPHMTVLENIAFPLKQQGIDKEEREKRAEKAANLVHLEEFLQRKPSQLSGGQQQRVALARAVVKEPRVLLLDEPLSNLDARLKVELRGEITRIVKSLGITTILVTHDQEEAMTMSDRVAIMNEGNIVQYSSPDQLYRNPESYFVAQFIGTPPMNFIDGQLSAKGNIQVGKHTIHWTDAYKAQNVQIGIRPHDMKLGDREDIVFNGEVILVETVGHSLLVTIQVDDQELRFIADPSLSIRVNTVVKVSVASEKIKLFDQETHQAIERVNKGEYRI